MNTSINLHQILSSEISFISKKAGISKSELVRKLILKINKFDSLKETKSALVEYQERLKIFDDFGELISAYKRVHFCPDGDMIDYCHKLRFLYRISLSKLVAASFLFFWDEILEEIFSENEFEKRIKNSYERVIGCFDNLIEYFTERLNYSIKEIVKRE